MGEVVAVLFLLWLTCYSAFNVDSYVTSMYACANQQFFENEIIPTANFDVSNWRAILPYVIRCLENAPHFATASPPAIYQFGIYQGASMRQLRSIFGNDADMYGFDSFQGLPDIVEEGAEHWHTGQFSPTSHIAKDIFKAKLRNELGKVQFIDGYYNESLSNPSTLVRDFHLRPSKYIDIDVDLYTSTVEALTFMITAELIQPGTIIGYDDFWSPFCNIRDISSSSVWSSAWYDPPHLLGEMKAHQEIAQRYNISFRCIAGSCLLPPAASHQLLGIPDDKYSSHHLWGAVFMIVDMQTPDAGLMQSKLEYLTWMDANARCQAIRKRKEE